jgi:cell division protein ZapB
MVSSNKLRAMNEELGSLEGKVERIIALCDALRAENRRLHDRIDMLEDEKEALVDRIGTARARLEDLMERLPAE